MVDILAPLTSVYWSPMDDTFYARRKDGTKKSIRSEVGFELAKRLPQETFEEWQARAEALLPGSYVQERQHG